MKSGFTIIEMLIGMTLLILVLGSILGIFIVVQNYVKDGIALADSQSMARMMIEEVVRPAIREGSSFEITDGGNTLTVTGYNSVTNIFAFNNGDGSDDTYGDNTLTKNGDVIASKIVKIPGETIFSEVEANERVGVDFGVKNQGIPGHFMEVRISTEIKLRN